MLTVGRKRCPFRCSYCFADFSQYERPVTLDDVESDRRLLAAVDVVYPACDVDLFALARWRDHLQRTARLGTSISISTKAQLDRGAVAVIAAVARELAARGQVLKVAISVSTRSRAAEYEPRAPSYQDRMATLRRLADGGVPTALVLRPLLAEIPAHEYATIVRDTPRGIRYVLTGPEHLDADPGHARRAIGTGLGAPRSGPVAWARDSPTWLRRDAGAQEAAVNLAAAGRDMRVFQNDMALMSRLRADLGITAAGRAPR
jgi:hypothetical protein